MPLKSSKKDAVIHGVKGGAQIQEAQQGDTSIVHGAKNIRKYSKQCSLGGIMSTVGRLQTRHHAAPLQILDQLFRNHAFDHKELQLYDPDLRYVYHAFQNKLARPAPESITAMSSDVKTLCSQFDDLTIGQDMILKRIWRNLGTEPEYTLPERPRRKTTVPFRYR